MNMEWMPSLSFVNTKGGGNHNLVNDAQDLHTSNPLEPVIEWNSY